MRQNTPVVFLVLVLVSGCSWGSERSGCDGSIRLVNPFPDTLSLALRDDIYDYPLDEPDSPVFEHSAGRFLSFSASSFDRSIVTAIARRSDSVDVLTLRTIAVGVAAASITAHDDCEGSQTQVFSVQVVQ